MHSGPHHDLCYAYGTQKEAMPVALRLAAVLMGAGAYSADKSRQEEVMAEADTMNQMMRVEEARKMRGVLESMMGPGGGVVHDQPNISGSGLGFGRYEDAMPSGSLFPKESAARIAHDFGRRLAHPMTEEEFAEKVANIDFAQFSSEERQELIKEAIGLGFLATIGKAFASAGKGALGGVRAAGRGVATGARATGGGARQAGGWLKKKLKPGWKSKALGLAALGGVAYGGAKAIQGTRDFMMQPSGIGGWRGMSDPNQFKGVSQYGYPI